MDKLCLIVVLGFVILHVVTGEGRNHYVLNGGWNDIICKPMYKPRWQVMVF
jgi:ribosomal silencing factor RsfS